MSSKKTRTSNSRGEGNINQERKPLNGGSTASITKKLGKKRDHQGVKETTKSQVSKGKNPVKGRSGHPNGEGKAVSISKEAKGKGKALEWGGGKKSRDVWVRRANEISDGRQWETMRTTLEINCRGRSHTT